MSLVSSRLDSIIYRQSLITNIVVNIIVFFVHYMIPKKRDMVLHYELFTTFFLTYIIDILFIQRLFNKNSKYIVIPYDDMWFRIKYLFNLNVFYKYLVVIGISFIITKAIIKYINRLLKKYNLFQRKENEYYRDIIITSIANTFISSVLINFIKFKWAYIDSDDVYLSATIFSLYGLAILISVSN